MSYSQPKTVSIIIPVYNERKTIATIIDRVAKADTLGLSKKIIIVNDGSTDGTAAILNKLRSRDVIVLHHSKNQGKGAAIRTGILKAQGEIVLIQDADLEYHPADYPVLLKPFFQNHVQVVYGSRELAGTNKPSSELFHLGGHLVTALTNLLYGSRLTDEPTGYKVFRRSLITSLPLRCQRFDFCPEVTAEILKRHIPITEVPITYTARSAKEGKKIRARDGLEAIWTLIRCRINL